jgi:CheY-like chemotaxis protein
MGKVKVLFVDDEEGFRILSIRLIKRLLKDHEFEFFEASDGEEALEWLKKGIKPSIIILDYVMPKIDGIELLKRMDSDHHDVYDVPRIMVSGYNHEDIKSEVKRLRCDFLEKGIDATIFCQQICQYMAVKLHFNP